MNSHISLGRIGGVPIYLDMMFLLMLMFFGSRYFISGDSQTMAMGLLIMAGLLVSILLHELGHAFAGRLFGVRTREIELTGLGGVARFANSLPRSVFAKTLIYMAGPAVNLVLWLGFDQVALAVAGLGKSVAFWTFNSLAFNNYWLLLFNLLPAFPLDGGRTLEAWLSVVMSTAWAIRIVAVLGLLVTLGCVGLAIQGNLWMLLLAFVLFQQNWAALQSVGGLSGGR